MLKYPTFYHKELLYCVFAYQPAILVGPVSRTWYTGHFITWCGYEIDIPDFPPTQLHAASRARVMVGVQGAGLQWAVFMPPSSHLVEIAWPQKHWGFYFQNYVRQYGINHHKVVASHVKPNWTTYENRVRGGNEVKMEERLEILSGKKVWNSFDHFWKWADAIVDEEDLVGVLQGVVMNL